MTDVNRVWSVTALVMGEIIVLSLLSFFGGGGGRKRYPSCAVRGRFPVCSAGVVAILPRARSAGWLLGPVRSRVFLRLAAAVIFGYGRVSMAVDSAGPLQAQRDRA